MLRRSRVENFFPLAPALVSHFDEALARCSTQEICIKKDFERVLRPVIIFM